MASRILYPSQNKTKPVRPISVGIGTLFRLLDVKQKILNVLKWSEFVCFILILRHLTHLIWFGKEVWNSTNWTNTHSLKSDVSFVSTVPPNLSQKAFHFVKVISFQTTKVDIQKTQLPITYYTFKNDFLSDFSDFDQSILVKC